MTLKFQYFFWKHVKEGMLFNMQPCIISQFQQNYSFYAVPELPRVFGWPNFSYQFITPFDCS